VKELLNRIVKGLFLGYSVVLAHAIGGATPEVSLTLLFAIVTSVVMSHGKELAGPNFAFQLLLFQILGHFMMADSDNSSLRMQLSHIAAAVITYQILIRFDAILNRLAEVFLPLSFASVELQPIFKVKITFAQIFHGFSSSLLPINRRGPPLFGGN